MSCQGDPVERGHEATLGQVPNPQLLAGDLRALLDRLAAAIPAGCPSDPCPICTAMEDLQTLARSLEGAP